MWLHHVASQLGKYPLQKEKELRDEWSASFKKASRIRFQISTTPSLFGVSLFPNLAILLMLFQFGGLPPPVEEPKKEDGRVDEEKTRQQPVRPNRGAIFMNGRASIFNRRNQPSRETHVTSKLGKKKSTEMKEKREAREGGRVPADSRLEPL